MYSYITLLQGLYLVISSRVSYMAGNMKDCLYVMSNFHCITYLKFLYNMLYSYNIYLNYLVTKHIIQHVKYPVFHVI